MISILALMTPALAADWTVGPEGDFTNLQDAVDAAADGDRLIVEAVFPDVVVIDGKTLDIEGISPDAELRELHLVDSVVTTLGLTILDGVTIDGGQTTSSGMRFDGGGAMGAPAITILDGTVAMSGARIGSWDTPDSPVAILDGDVTLAGFSFEATSGDAGGAIRIEGGNVTVETSAFESTSALQDGGAIAITGGTVIVDACSFEAGSAERGGFLSSEGAALTVTDSVFDAGQASDSGGAIYASASQLSLADVMFDGSSSFGAGGAISVMGGALSAIDLGSRDATADDGGHIWLGGGGSAELTRTVLQGGQAARGGGVYNEFSDLTVRNAMWTGVEYAESGGGYHQESGSLYMEFAVLADHVAEIGAGFAVASGDAMFEGVIVYGNRGDSGVNAGTGDVALRHSIVYGNTWDPAQGVRMGAGAGIVDPLFYSPTGGDWAMHAFSPGLDSGPAGQVDHDLSSADMGPYGGPLAWELPDADEDGRPYGRDCDDADPDIHEMAIDHWYDGVDSDCRRNDDFDQDSDGHAAAQYGGDDCDDVDPMRNPSVYEETGDAFDSDCDGLLDRDEDGDGWATGVDCDDTNPDIYPGAEDAPYDGIDADCRGDFDDDYDGDGWPRGEDCDDEDPTISPSSPEISDDGIDQDCDGSDRTMDLGDDEASAWPVPSDLDDAAPWRPDAPPRKTAVTTGCSSAPAPSNLAAALMVLAGILLHRRRR